LAVLIQPFGRLKTLNNATTTKINEFNTLFRAQRLFQQWSTPPPPLVKPVITKHATDSSGIFRTNWKMLSSVLRFVHEMEPRLEGVSEGEWATGWDQSCSQLA